MRPDKKEVVAVKDVSLSVEPGEVVGFLGPNGAGETTTLKMLSGIIHPTSGKIEVLGHVPTRREPELLRRLGLVMGNKNQLWWDLPARDSFEVLRRIYDVTDADFKSRLDRLLPALDLEDKIDQQVRKLSLGERMKCELVAALIHAPAVLFLDEPTIGLDVVSQGRIREFLREIHRERGTTMLLTSHYMQDVEALCDRIVIIDHGTVVFEGTLDDLRARYGDTKTIRATFSQPVERADLEAIGHVGASDALTASIDIPRNETRARVAALLDRLPVTDLMLEETAVDDLIRRIFEEQAPGSASA
ncbi:ATP-binding cassette domain-containing protein [bacterium]|nr:MAG: ATP-binding cassette domain-containing protein [bacterium]